MIKELTQEELLQRYLKCNERKVVKHILKNYKARVKERKKLNEKRRKRPLG